MTREIQVKIRENSYKVEFPNVGKLQDIERLKAVLSGGMYGSMESNRTMDGQFALDMIDMEAYFTVLIPDLIEDLKVKSFRNLSIEDAVEIKEIFVKQLLPFMKQWRDIINKPMKSDGD